MTLHETPDIPETKHEFRNGGFCPVSKENVMTDLEKLLAGATPGPWHTHMVDETSIVGPDGSDVATTCDSGNTERSDAYNVEYERMEADARLIALTPQLASALIEARKALEQVAVEWRSWIGADVAFATLARIDAIMGGAAISAPPSPVCAKKGE